MEDQLISFETAKLAKQKGFDNIYCSTCYCIGFAGVKENKNFRGNSRKKIGGQYHLALAPTQSLLQRWLREEHNCFVEVKLHGEEDNIWNINPENLLFGVTVDYYGKSFEIPMTDEEDYSEYNFKSYEEALEKGLCQALKLIKDE